LNPQEGIVRREEIRKNQPDDLLNLLRLAELYVRVDQPEKAEELYKEAHAKKPESLEIADSYSKFLRDVRSRPQEAEQLLRETVEANQENENLVHAAAQILLAAHLYTMHERGGPDAPDLETSNKAFRKAARISQKAAVLVEVGTYFMTVDKLAEAEKWLRQAVDNARDKPEQRQTFVTAHRRLLDLMTQLRDPSRTDEILQEIDYHQRNINEDYALLARAELFASVGRDDDALKVFETFIQKNPNDPIGYYRRALVHFRRGNYDAAIADLNQVKRISPSFGNYEPRLTLAQAYELSGQPGKAVDEYRVMVDAGVGGFDVIRRLYDSYLRQGRLDAAANMIRPMAERQPGNPSWSLLLAEIADRRGHIDEAIALGKEAAEKSGYASNMLSFVFNQMLSAERYDDLVNYINNNISEDAWGQGVLMTLAAAYAGQGDLEKALDTARQAYVQAEGRLDIFMQFYLRNINMPDLMAPEKVQSTLQARVEDGSADRADRLMLAGVLNAHGEQDRAVELIEGLIESLSGQERRDVLEKFFLVRQLGKLKYEVGDYQQSRKYYEQALEIEEDDAGTMNNLAYLLMDKLNDPKAALPYAKKAARLMGQNPSVLDTLGWNYVLLGQYDEGIGWLHKSVELNPDNASIYYHLAEALQRRSESSQAKTGDREEARQMCRRAHELIVESGADPHGELARIATLGDKLGLKLSKTL
jgi:tetratricopeptide (TPR) repeat protein